MARMVVTLDGTQGAPLLMHNERMIDPLNPYVRSVKELSGKRQRSEVDELELSHREWLGCFYYDEEIGPYLPVWCIVRCIQEAGKRHKLGASVLRGVVPASEKTPVLYDGPRDLDTLWKDGRYALRKAVGVGQKRVMRTRPVFVDWTMEAEIEVDLTQIDPEKINQLIAEGGRYQAVGDYRPVYGRFLGSAALVDPAAAAAEMQDIAA